MMNETSKYMICLPDTEAILPELAKIIGAQYQPGTFSEAEDNFHDSGKDSVEWNLEGKSGVRFSVLIEKHEGYYFSSVYGSGDTFNKAKVYLYEKYLSQGGNPQAQEKP